MNSRAILREAWRNLTSGTTRALTMLIALGLITLTLQLADLSAVRQIVQDAAEYQRVGASVLTLTAPQKINGRACEALNGLPGVRAAGALREASNDVRLTTLPQSPVPLKETTPSFSKLLRAESSEIGGYILSSQVTEPLGLTTGDLLQTTQGETHVSGRFDYPDDGRKTGLGYSALVVGQGNEPFDECWLDIWPQNREFQGLLLTTLIPVSSNSTPDRPVLGQLNSTLGSTFDGAGRYSSRITLLAYPLAAALAFALGFVATRLRRMELAAALHSRVSRSALLRVLMVEALSWALPVLIIGVSVSAWFAASGPSQDEALTLLQGTKLPLLTVVAALAGTTTAFVAIRESHLFKYFKNR